MATSLALLLVLLPLGCGRDRAGREAPLATSAPAAPLQEVAPPPGVQQLATALAEHSPQVRILAPADGSTLPDAPWTLRLHLHDWPLADAGELGLGAHVVVQLDDEPPQRIAAADSADADSAELSLTMAPLRPGSHRLTVFAARPWGEVVKSPGASGQIQLQRVAPTPLRVPPAGSPQLIAVSPGPEPRPEPVLVDWLLLDAPLQGLREGDASWRLRVSVNGDSFLVDQNSPLWLKGWRTGSNSLQLDLVDGRGEPLNPPFNSLVSEVVIQANARRPAWLSPLEPAALARLLGQAPPAATGDDEGAMARDVNPEPTEEDPLEEEPIAEQPLEEVPEPASPDELDALELASANAENQELDQAEQQPVPLQTQPGRIAPSTSLSGSAREQVRDDGSLIQPRGNGPLAGLRQRLGA